MSKTQMKFDKAVREAMEGYEFPYDSNSWNAMEKQLNRSDKSRFMRDGSFLAAAALLGAGLFAWWFFGNPGANQQMFGRLAVKAELIQPEFDSNTNSVLMRRAEMPSVNQTTGITYGEREETQVSKPGTQALNETGVTSQLTQSESSAVIEKESKAEQKSDKLSEAGSKKSKTSADLMVMPTKREACVSEVIGFGINLDFVGNEKFLWNFGDGTFSNQPNPTHKYSQPGTYDVSLSVTSTADGVIRSKVMEKLVVVYPKPDAKFDWEYLNKSYEPVKVKLLNKSENGTNATWHIDEDVLGNGISPVATFDSKGDYGIKLTVINEFGCSDSRYKYITVDADYNLMAPSRVSVGEGFMPKALRHLKRPFHLTVLDNSGMMVYETKDINKPWDCTLQSGSIAPTGSTFKWVVSLIDEAGIERIYGGDIELIP